MMRKLKLTKNRAKINKGQKEPTGETEFSETISNLNFQLSF